MRIATVKMSATSAIETWRSVISRKNAEQPAHTEASCRREAISRNWTAADASWTRTTARSMPTAGKRDCQGTGEAIVNLGSR